MGPAGLNFRVRDGNGCDPRGVITDKPVRACGAHALGIWPFGNWLQGQGLIAKCAFKERVDDATTESIGLSTADPAAGQKADDRERWHLRTCAQ